MNEINWKALSRPTPEVLGDHRNCLNCTHHRGPYEYGHCLRAGTYASISMAYGPCSSDLKLWAPKPHLPWWRRWF